MKKVVFVLASMLSVTTLFGKQSLTNDITYEIPSITHEIKGFQHIPEVAQYKEADWNNVIGIARNISLREAIRIARKNPDITYFFYTKGGRMILEKTDGSYRVFHHGDTVFFTGEPWWGSAPGLADGYIKQ